MKSLLPALLFCLSQVTAAAQENLQKKAADIVQEAKKLYRSEMASWYGTDVFLERFPALKDKFSGYFSYTDGGLSRCLFFSKEESPKVLAAIAFDSTYNTQTAVVSGSQREFSALEKSYYDLRQNAAAQIQNDTLFKAYKGTNFNLVPLVDGDVKKVYVLTGTSQQGVVMFGNDYLLTYDGATNLVEKRRLHKSLIPINYRNEKKEDGVMPFGAMHSHLPELGEPMTPTDVCTLMLYQNLTHWKQHIVVSKNYVSIWDADTQTLTIISKEA